MSAASPQFSWNSFMSDENLETELDTPVKHCCPLCQKATDSLKDYNIPIVVFLVFGFGSRDERVIACPPCMRNQLEQRLLQSIVLANLFFPFMLFWYGCLIMGTYSQGPSGSISQPNKRSFMDWVWRFVGIALLAFGLFVIIVYIYQFCTAREGRSVGD